MDIEATVKEVFSLYEKYGEVDYIGEAVTQVQHALQAAQQAEMEKFPREVVLGAFLHDIGHLIGIRDGTARMITAGHTLGAQHHEVVGSEYLSGLGFPPSLTFLVRYHVQAKRFLVATDPNYYNTLSEASRLTLEHQGGPMTPEEVENFRKDPRFESILHMRKWDEHAKDPSAITPSLDHYREMCLQILQEAKE